MHGEAIRETLLQGKPVFGVAIEGYGQPRWPRFFAQVGLDFVFLDSEHNPRNRETIAWAAQTYAAFDMAPLLRIPEVSPTQAAMGLDAGAHGIIVPYVETVEQARVMVGAVKYRPLKGAALKKAVEDGQFPNEETRRYLEAYNRNTVLIIMIESPAGVANLSDLLAVGGVDAVLIGPHDLSVSHGVPEQYDHPTFLQAAQQVITTCRNHSVGVGIHYTTDALGDVASWIEWGCNLICQRSDSLFAARGMMQELGELRQQADVSIEALGKSGHAD